MLPDGPGRTSNQYLLKKVAQVIWYRHDLHRRDARPACVPDGNPDARKKKRCQHARHLTKNFPEIALLDTYAKHEPMRVGVLHCAALAEDMRALKMIEAFGIVAVLESRPRERDFRSVCGGELVHDGKIVVDLQNDIVRPCAQSISPSRMIGYPVRPSFPQSRALRKTSASSAVIPTVAFW